MRCKRRIEEARKS